MKFQHSAQIWSQFPALVPGVMAVSGITPEVSVAERAAPYQERAKARLAAGPESEFPEIQAWRRAYSTMGLKPTQYRSASESLLRRFKKEQSLPEIHPLIDICNAVSLAFAIPVAVFDVDKVAGDLEVRLAHGDETYLTFGGDVENPEPGEVVFADDKAQLHARRWVNRQSGLSAVRPETASVLIVAEALHENASQDVPALADALAGELAAIWSVTAQPRILSSAEPRYEF